MDRASGSDPGAARQVCILSRKDLRDLTRVPRMARALSEAGYGCTVVSLRPPVPELREMSPDTRYIAAAPRPITAKLLAQLNRRVQQRRQRREDRDLAYRRALLAGGVRAATARARRSIALLCDGAAELAQRVFVLPPLAFALQRADQDFAAAWRAAVGQDTLRTLGVLVGQVHRWALAGAFAREAENATRGRCFDVVQAHDSEALVAAARLAARDGAALVYDAVELSSHRLATNFGRFERLREWCERRREARIFRSAAAMITVGEGLADWYSRIYQTARPLVVRNCRYYWRYAADGRLRADAGVGPDTPLVVWFGGAYPEQGLELLIRAVALMPPAIHAAIIATALPRWVPFVEGLPRLAAALGVGGRVHILPPRAPNDLVPYASGADLGIIPRPSQHLNNFYSMPNKFLEMIMARLPIAVSRLGDMVDAVNRYEIGSVFDERDPGDVAAVVARMLEPGTHARLRANVMRLAEETTWEKESVHYVELMRGLILQKALRTTPSQTGAEQVAQTTT